MKLYFVYAVAAIIFTLGNTESPKEKYQRLDNECKQPNAITPHTLCMNVKWGIQTENGDIDADVLRTKFATNPRLSAEDVNKVVSECGTRKGDTAGEAADALGQCIRKVVGAKYTLEAKRNNITL